MGRILVIALLAVLVVPAVVLWRLWRDAGQRRMVNEGTLGFLTPTIDAERTMARWPNRARKLRVAGLGAGLVLVVLLAVRIGTLSVFGWPLALALGYLLGVLAGELARPRPTWTVSDRAVGRISDYIAPVLVWALRAVSAVAVGLAVTVAQLSTPDPSGGSGLAMSCPGGGTQFVGSGQLTDGALVVLVLTLTGWLGSELTLLRILRRPVAAELEDVPVDEALRSASAHASVAAASVLTLLPLGFFALATGFGVVGSCGGSDLLSVGLIAGGLAAVLAGLLVAAFLPSWLRPVERKADVRS